VCEIAIARAREKRDRENREREKRERETREREKREREREKREREKREREKREREKREREKREREKRERRELPWSSRSTSWYTILYPVSLPRIWAGRSVDHVTCTEPLSVGVHPTSDGATDGTVIGKFL
jgi:hypothetical protein